MKRQPPVPGPLTLVLEYQDWVQKDRSPGTFWLRYGVVGVPDEDELMPFNLLRHKN